MISLLRRLFIDNWQRKLASLVLAMIVWMVVNHSMSSQKTIHNIPVKILNIPNGKTVEGLQTNGILNKRISLTLVGNKNTLDELNGGDLEVAIDAEGKPDEWIATITKKNLVSLNPGIEITQAISKISHHDFIIKLSKLAKEKIPVSITQPVGEAPKGYQFLGVWPYQLQVAVTGPEELVKKLKARGLKLTFNLSDISQQDLDALQESSGNKKSEETSYFVPDAWKKITIPSLSETPFAIDDPMAKGLRVDFIKTNLIPFAEPIPVTVFFPPKYSQTLNSDTYSLATDDFVKKMNGQKLITTPLFAKGVSRQFVEIAKDMMQIVIVAAPKSESEHLIWQTQFISPQTLENRYVAKVLSQSSDDLHDLQPELREEYLRSRFRSYINNFRLFTQSGEKLDLDVELKANTITVTPKNSLEKK
jgi:hypothetical protein